MLQFKETQEGVVNVREHKMPLTDSRIQQVTNTWFLITFVVCHCSTQSNLIDQKILVRLYSTMAKFLLLLFWFLCEHLNFTASLNLKLDLDNKNIS